MGVGYNKAISQWSKGEYADANNAQDDIAVMQSFGLPLRTDDHGSGFATATAMGTTRNAAGLIEQRTDTDVLSFNRTCGGSTTTMSIYIYRAFFKVGDVGLAVAASMLLLVASFVVLFAINKLTGRSKPT